MCEVNLYEKNTEAKSFVGSELIKPHETPLSFSIES